MESSLPTWDAFCAHQDQATLAADPEYRSLYTEVVRQYAGLAEKDGKKNLGKSIVTVPEAIRLREAGLEATKSVLTSDALSSESGRQLGVLLPAVLSNMHAGDSAHLGRLKEAAKENDQDEKDRSYQRRQSMNTIRTTENSIESDPRAAGGTAADADKLAEEEVGVLALQCLKAVFAVDNRAQVRTATATILNYFARLASPRPATSASTRAVGGDGSWDTHLFETICAWTPVQDRFIILVTAVETLIRLPMREAELPKQLSLAELVGHVLRSDLNLIGLSVMDVLLGVIQHILRVLQLNSMDGAAPMGQQPQLLSGAEDMKKSTMESNRAAEVVQAPSPTRMQLLERLQRCIGDLATHLYYTDQVSDMISAILLRLKPTPLLNQNAAVTAAAIEDPSAAAAEVASSASLHEKPHTDGFFSFDTAREVALQGVKDILIVANSQRANGMSATADSRNAVPIYIWEGTQWLLRDQCEAVRRAYADALCTWLTLETKKGDSRIQEPGVPRKAKPQAANDNLARRAVSNASTRERASKRHTGSFLQLLHLAVYDNALQHAANSEPDLLLLHLLLTSLTRKLGVNAVRSSLPMVMRLQEEIAAVESPAGKIRIGSFVHGYFSALSDVFDLDQSVPGREIQSEITRRKTHHLWTDGVTIPPRQIGQIPLSATVFTEKLDPDFVQHEIIKPFDHRQELVDRIDEAYSTTVSSPPASAPGSPGRSFSLPALNSTNSSSYLTARSLPTQLPERVKEEMLAEWTKEACLASVAAAAPKSASLSGSRSSPSNNLGLGYSNHRQLLAAANTFPMNNTTSGSLASSPQNGQVQQAPSHRQQAFGLMSRRLHSQSPDRRPSASTGRKSSSPGAKGTLRVGDLKQVLAGGGVVGFAGTLGRREHDETGSESMVDVEDGDFDSESGDGPPEADRSASQTDPAGTEGATSTVPDDPPNLRLPAASLTDGQIPEETMAEIGRSTLANGAPARPPSSKRGASRTRERTGGRRDLSQLLEEINIGASSSEAEDRPASMGRPPY